MLETKAIEGVEVKDADKGEVLVRFATLGVVDLDGDIIRPGAIGKQKVLVSTYGHGTTRRGDPPVGLGKTRESNDQALADLKYFVTRQRAREEFEAVADTAELGQWSFFYEVQQASAPSEDERRMGAYRVLDKIKVVHVAPVERGSGIDTATISAKEAALKAAEDLPPIPDAGEAETTDDDAAASSEEEEGAAGPAADAEADEGDAAGSESGFGEESNEEARKGLFEAAEQEELATIRAHLDRNDAVVKAMEAREAADTAQREAVRLTADADSKRSADEAEQKAIQHEFERFQKTRRRLEGGPT